MKELLSASLENSTLPDALTGLYGESSPSRLNNLTFGLQVRNIYDILNARDVLETNVISAEYPGRDHHRTMRALAEPALEDIFGVERGLDTLGRQLNPEIAEDVACHHGEFGRQPSQTVTKASTAWATACCSLATKCAGASTAICSR